MSKLIKLTSVLLAVLVSYKVYASVRVCPNSYFFDSQHC